MRQLKITKSITNRESASLDKYLQEIGKEELITVEEEVELAQRIKKGDQEALEKLTIYRDSKPYNVKIKEFVFLVEIEEIKGKARLEKIAPVTSLMTI